MCIRDRVEPGGAYGGIEPKNVRRAGGHAQRQDDRRRVDGDGDGEAGQRGQQRGYAVAQADAQQPADQAEHQRLGQKLHQDVAVVGAQRPAQPDLVEMCIRDRGSTALRSAAVIPYNRPKFVSRSLV